MKNRTRKRQTEAVPAARPPAQPSVEEIALCAYGIWEREGRPVGRDLEHWLQAEAILRRERQGGAAGA